MRNTILLILLFLLVSNAHATCPSLEDMQLQLQYAKAPATWQIGETERFFKENPDIARSANLAKDSITHYLLYFYPSKHKKTVSEIKFSDDLENVLKQDLWENQKISTLISLSQHKTDSNSEDCAYYWKSPQGDKFFLGFKVTNK